MGTEVEQQRSIAVSARAAFDNEQVALIRATVARNASTAELAMFLELARRYELDPFAGQIYFTKMPGSNGEEGRPAIIVGRDGFLTIANRHSDFEGMTGDVVYENDEFVKTENPDGPGVQHTVTNPGARGACVGAWSIVYRTGRRPIYFFAPLDQYLPTSERKLKYSPWGTQLDVMILKCAQSTALRLAFNITGLIGEEEASAALARDQAPAASFEYAEDEALAIRLAQLFAVLAELRPDEFRPAKVRLILRGRSEDERFALVSELEKKIVDLGGEIPEPVEIEEAQIVTEADVDLTHDDDVQVSEE